MFEGERKKFETGKKLREKVDQLKERKKIGELLESLEGATNAPKGPIREDLFWQFLVGLSEVSRDAFEKLKQTEKIKDSLSRIDLRDMKLLNDELVKMHRKQIEELSRHAVNTGKRIDLLRELIDYRRSI